MRLADAFIQRDLQLHSGYTFLISMCVPWELNPQPFALLTQCSTNEPHRNTQEYIYIYTCPCSGTVHLIGILNYSLLSYISESKLNIQTVSIPIRSSWDIPTHSCYKKIDHIHQHPHLHFDSCNLIGWSVSAEQIVLLRGPLSSTRSSLIYILMGFLSGEFTGANTPIAMWENWADLYRTSCKCWHTRVFLHSMGCCG